MSRLIGLRQIMAYEQKSEKIVRFLIQKRNYPAVKIGREYEAVTELVEKWRRRIIEEETANDAKG